MSLWVSLGADLSQCDVGCEQIFRASPKKTTEKKLKKVMCRLCTAQFFQVPSDFYSWQYISSVVSILKEQGVAEVIRAVLPFGDD